MLIFDKFATRKQADACAEAVAAKYGLETAVFDSWEESQESDPFPFDLLAPILHVERRESVEAESEIRRFVEQLGGVFAGT